MALRFNSLRHARTFKLGRAAHNAAMQRQAEERRRRLVELVNSGRFKPKASQALADALGCHRDTVWRDLKRLDLDGRCLHCGQLLPEVIEAAVLDAG